MRTNPIRAWLNRHYPALEHPLYVRLLWATAFSGLGSQFTVLALSVAVYSATGSVASLAGIWAVRVASRLLLQPFTGALADRWDRRRTLVGGYLLSALLAASLVLVLQSVGSLQQNLFGLVQDGGMLYESLLYFERLERFLALPPTLRQPSKPREVRSFEEVRFEQVGFTYPDGRRALQGVGFTLRRGERLALVGENGAGKTTLVKLLLRFYDPSEGRILVDGVDLRELDLAAWRRLVAAVFQDFGRYALTLGENIALSDLEHLHDPQRLEEAARAGGAEGLLLRLGPEVLLSRAFGGTELSLGEWQRVALSRAFFRQAELLVLDEPTASLDPKEEAHLYARFAELAQGKTVLLITHRLGSVRMADRILVLSGGRLVEEGDHATLLGQQGAYAELWRLQADLYRPDLTDK